MQNVNLRSVDLNLLVALHALLEERSITAAAKRIFVSQPAMSRIMDRLQEMFDDELLVRTAKGYEPTHRAAALHGELEQLLPRLNALFGERPFDPATVRETFCIETTDWGATVLIPEMVQIVVQRAPGIEIDILPRGAGFEHLEANEVDLVLAPNSSFLTSMLEKNTSHLRTEPLCQEKLICMVRSGHPLAKGRMTIRRFLDARHVVLTPMLGKERRSILVEEMLRQIGRGDKDLETAVRVPYFAPLGPIVEKTDLVAIVPLQVARRLKTPTIKLLPAPSPFSDFTYNHVWHSRNDANPVHKWLRDILRGVGAKVS